MFKRSEKKIKAVFKMEFSASQVPQLKAKSLMISLVPVDVGKPTVRLAKAPIIEGTCIWESPVYETIKLVMETKTGRIREKFYYVIVSTGSSKSGFLGEVSIDFADLAEASKPVNLTLPLQTSKSGAVLHVTVQKIQGGIDSRYDEDSEAPGDESYDQNMDADSCGKRDLTSLESVESYQVSPRDEQNGSLDKLKMLGRNLEIAELEVQSLRKQIMKETKKGQQLLEQIDCLKEERDALKAEYEQFKSSCKNDEKVPSHTQGPESLRSSPEKVKQDLEREKQLNKKLKFQLQKSEDSNSEYVLAMRDLTKKLEQRNTEIAQLSRKINDFHSLPEEQTPEDLTSNSRYADEIEMLEQKIEDLNSEIDIYKKEKSKLQLEVERLLQDLESLETENENIYSKLEQTEKEHSEVQIKYEESLATMKQLKLRIASLEAENKRQALQNSESLNMIDELEFQVESLHKELEKQGQAFGEDLQAMTREKVELEERAIQAEEDLKSTRWDNENAAKRLQAEIKQISSEMSLKIEENEKLAWKATAEADDLRQKNEVLEEQLQLAEEELKLARDKYERMLQEHAEQNKQKAGSNHNSKDGRPASFTDESEKMQKNIEESETLQRWKLEKEDLERQLASVRKEAEKVKNENISIKSQMDQKKTKEENLHLEVKKLRLKNNEVKSQLAALEKEKQELKKEMSKVQNSLSKAQEREKAAKQNHVISPAKEKSVMTGRSKQETMPIKDPSVGSCDISSVLSEVSSLKERNRSMEEELKEMHDRYSEISLKFAEVEGERQQLVMTVRNLKSGKKN